MTEGMCAWDKNLKGQKVMGRDSDADDTDGGSEPPR